MRWTLDQMPDCSGRTVVVTGANSGIGYEAVHALAVRGADVILACRSPERARAAEQRLRAQHPGAQLTVLALDLASLDSVREFAERVLELRPTLHGLVNNAGVMAIPRMLTRDGFEMQLGTNHFGHFALTGLLIERLLATPGSRIVTVSSQASRIGKLRLHDLDGEKRYAKWAAYGQSKLANLLFAFGLARRLEAVDAGTSSVACHPGYAATNLQHVGPQLERSHFLQIGARISNALFGQSAATGALPTLYALTNPDVDNGDFIGPRGLGQFWGTPRKVRARRAAYSETLMDRLWQVSVERTGIDFAALERAALARGTPAHVG